MDGVYLQTQKMQCLQIGEGKKILFAFHGFGQNPNVFECLRPLLPEYTIYSFDLLSFGKEPSKQTCISLINEFCNNQAINTFSVLSFSIGSKMALSLVEYFSERIEKLILIAPDGFKKNYWYQFATSYLGKKVFWQFIKNPVFFLKIAQFLSKFKILDKHLLRIAQSYTDSPPKRFLVWRTWLSQKYLFPNHKALHKVYQKNEICTQIFTAAKDKICPIAPILTFSKPYRCIEVIQSPFQHHRLLKETLKNSYFLGFLK
jgi:pimeloyl-ACP methyl ester carboxylesterase